MLVSFCRKNVGRQKNQYKFRPRSERILKIEMCQVCIAQFIANEIYYYICLRVYHVL